MNRTTLFRLCASVGLAAARRFFRPRRCFRARRPSDSAQASPRRMKAGTTTPTARTVFSSAISVATRRVRSTCRSVRTIISNRAIPTGSAHAFPDRPTLRHVHLHHAEGVTRKQKISWVLTVNGVTTSVPFYMSPDYNVTPFKSSGQGPRRLQRPASAPLRGKGPSFRVRRQQSRRRSPSRRGGRADDPRSGRTTTRSTRAAAMPRRGIPPAGDPRLRQVSGTRGDHSGAPPKFEAVKGGKPDEPYTESLDDGQVRAPGEYMLHVTANDFRAMAAADRSAAGPPPS